MTIYDKPHEPIIVFKDGSMQVVRAWNETDCVSFLGIERATGWSRTGATPYAVIEIDDTRCDFTAQQFIKEMAQEIEQLRREAKTMRDVITFLDAAAPHLITVPASQVDAE